MARGALFGHFCVSRVITTAHAQKNGVIFHFFQDLSNKKIKALRAKKTKIASMGPALSLSLADFFDKPAEISWCLVTNSEPEPLRPGHGAQVERLNTLRLCMAQVEQVSLQVQPELFFPCGSNLVAKHRRAEQELSCSFRKQPTGFCSDFVPIDRFSDCFRSNFRNLHQFSENISKNGSETFYCLDLLFSSRTEMESVHIHNVKVSKYQLGANFWFSTHLFPQIYWTGCARWCLRTFPINNEFKFGDAPGCHAKSFIRSPTSLVYVSC